MRCKYTLLTDAYKLILNLDIFIVKIKIGFNVVGYVLRYISRHALIKNAINGRLNTAKNMAIQCVSISLKPTYKVVDYDRFTHPVLPTPNCLM